MSPEYAAQSHFLARRLGPGGTPVVSRTELFRLARGSYPSPVSHIWTEKSENEGARKWSTKKQKGSTEDQGKQMGGE